MKTVKLEVTPSQVFDKYYKIVQTAAGLCGANVFQENYRLTAMTYFVMLCIVLFFSFIGYTMFHDLVIDRDYIKFLQVLCIIGTGIQVCILEMSINSCILTLVLRHRVLPNWLMPFSMLGRFDLYVRKSQQSIKTTNTKKIITGSIWMIAWPWWNASCMFYCRSISFWPWLFSRFRFSIN